MYCPRPYLSFILQCTAHPIDLHSFPTRRSSDLEMAEAPNRSYSFAWVTGSTSIWIAPFEGEDRLISAMIFICVVPLIFFLKGMGSPGWLGVNFFPLKMATSFSFSLIILFKIVMLDYPAFCLLTEFD